MVTLLIILVVYSKPNSPTNFHVFEGEVETEDEEPDYNYEEAIKDDAYYDDDAVKEDDLIKDDDAFVDADYLRDKPVTSYGHCEEF